MEVQSIILVIAIPLILMLTRRLRTLELGDDLAAGLGLPVKRSVNLLVAAAVLLVAIAISVAGPIGFLALIAPQLARRFWHTPGTAMWHSALMGAAILVLADFVAARALAPFQIPVGLVTGAIGGLYMLWLLNRQRH
jgi:ABC-type enterobactin transport system, permease component